MKLGDEIYIHVLDETHAYKVKEIKTVEPEELQNLTITPDGEDLVTLVTCTPYGVNTHRLLVTGERTEYVKKEEKEQAPSLIRKFMPWRYYTVSYTHLKFIKIDIDSNPDKCKIVENIVGYAHEREMKVIAEGIETIEELKQVIRLRVDYLQGYLFSKPQYLPPKIRDNIVKLIQVVNEEV